MLFGSAQTDLKVFGLWSKHLLYQSVHVLVRFQLKGIIAGLSYRTASSQGCGLAGTACLASQRFFTVAFLKFEPFFDRTNPNIA